MIAGQGDLYNYLPLEGVDTILDVGPGVGEASDWFIKRGLEVTACGIDSKSYEPDAPFIVSRIESMYKHMLSRGRFASFDAVWCAHVLEHTLNVGLALENMWLCLREGGWLFLMVPPYKAEVVGGHVSTGWTIGQLMYVLILTGFDVKNGHFVKHKYNVAAFVRKIHRSLPELRYDYGDIEALKDYWPEDPLFKHGFNGDMIKWYWPPEEGR